MMGADKPSALLELANKVEGEAVQQGVGASSRTGLSQAEPVPVSGLTAFEPSRYENKPRYLPQMMTQQLRSFWMPIFDRIGALDEFELQYLVDSCRSVSPINCAWQDYAIARLVHDGAAQALEARRAETAQTGSVHESAVRQDAPISTPTPGDHHGR